jgi:hypothetical protein
MNFGVKRFTSVPVPALAIFACPHDWSHFFPNDPARRAERLARDTAQCNALADERYADRPVTYLFGFEDRSDVIDGFGTAMFINHSCSPNCITESSTGRVFIRALRDIAPNEELLYEYNLYDSEDDDQTCYCNAPNCRGTMLSDWELKRQARLAARKKARTNGHPGPKARNIQA